MTAISGVEIALWDLAGKILEAPVCKLLGGQYRDGVRAYWTRSPRDMLDPASCREFASALKSHPYGITAVKSDADAFPARYDPQFREPGHEPYSGHLTSKDLARIARGFANLREALGEDVDIAVHCHWEFDWIDALNLARAVAPIKPAWLEDPMPPDFSESWVKLTAARAWTAASAIVIGCARGTRPRAPSAARRSTFWERSRQRRSRPVDEPS